MWGKYKDILYEGILKILKKSHSKLAFNDKIYNEAVILIEDKVISISGKVLNME